MRLSRNFFFVPALICVVGFLILFGAGPASATSYTYEIFSSPFEQSLLDGLYHGNTTNQFGGSVTPDGTGFSLCSGGNCSNVNPPALPLPAYVPPTSYYATFLGINNVNQVAVTYGNAYGPCYSYSWQNGVYTPIAGQDPHVTGINNRGEIVGSFANSGASGYAYVWENGQSTTLIPSGTSWEFTRPYGINEEGTVWGWGSIMGAGFGRMLNGIWSYEYWFTATPVRTPEPYNLLLIASGLIALLGFRKSIRK